MSKLKAVVVGLGNIGFQFNLDNLRRGTWTHVDAYDSFRGTELVGALEIDKDKTRTFKRYHRDIPVFKTIKELMRETSADIVSICTPTKTHYAILKELAQHPVKAIFCEKPIADTVNQAEEMVRLCKSKGILLAVNHTRRWDENYRFVKKAVQSGAIGTVNAVNALYPAQVFNMGTHMFDTVRMLIGKNAVKVSGFFVGEKKPDPDISGWIKFEDDIFCSISATGKREDLIFEIDIIGDEGRIRIVDNGAKIEQYSFMKSRRLAGYRELFSINAPKIKEKDRFGEAIRDIALVVKGKKKKVNCSGEDGLASLALSNAMRISAEAGGKPQKAFAFAK